MNRGLKCHFCSFEFNNNDALDIHLSVVHNSQENKRNQSTIPLNLAEFQMNNNLEKSNFNQGLDETYVHQEVKDSEIQGMEVYQYEILNEEDMKNFDIQQNVELEDGKIPVSMVRQLQNFEVSKTIQSFEDFNVLQCLEKSDAGQGLNLFGDDEIPVSIVRNNQTPEGSNYLNFDESLVGPGFEQSHIGKDLNESYIGQGLDNTYIGNSLDESKVGPNEENPLPKRRMERH